MWKVLMVLALASLMPENSVGQSAPAAGGPASVPKTGVASDPMAVGKAALSKEDYASARTFFESYLKDNPGSAEATFLLANAELGARHFAEAERGFRAALVLNPELLMARKNLVILYAEAGRWDDFDKERLLIAAAQRAKGVGASPVNSGGDVLDVFEVNGSRYIAHGFDPLAGRFHTRYRFVHFGADGRLQLWIDCESDDIDQVSFAKTHPKEAAEGKRSFSLDSYTAPSIQPNGTQTQTHSTLKFYADGEPTYEAVRADVIRAVGGKAGPMSSSTSNQK